MRKTDEWDFRTFSKGEVIFRAGEEADVAYVIHSGSVDIISNRSGKDEVIETLSSTEFIGEMALIDHEPRSATAIAKEDTSLVVFTKEEFEESMEKSDFLTHAILGLLTKRLRKLTIGDAAGT